jgi:hypothetical protein
MSGYAEGQCGVAGEHNFQRIKVVKKYLYISLDTQLVLQICLRIGYGFCP